MSKYNVYVQKLNEIAKASISEYVRAADRLKTAESARKQYPHRNGVLTADYAASSARAQADYLEATREVERVRQKMTTGEYSQQIAQLRQKLVAEIENDYSVKPEQVDANALELLKSGIMSVNEYDSMLKNALANGNVTMARLVGKYAEEAADTRANPEHGGVDDTAAALRSIGIESKQHTGSVYTRAFDMLIETYSCCVNNPAMMRSWDELTENTVRAF